MKRIKDEKTSILIYQNCLGRGQFGEVYKGYEETDPKTYYAVKIISKEKFKRVESQDCLKTLKREFEIIKEIEHENVVKHYKTLETGNNYYLLMEFCGGVIYFVCFKFFFFISASQN